MAVTAAGAVVLVAIPAQARTVPPPAQALARPGTAAADGSVGEVRSFDPAWLAGLPLLDKSGKPMPQASPVPKTRRSATAKASTAAAVTATGVTPPVGTTRQWYAIDQAKNSFALKDFTLRSIGAHIEVWVADDTTFPGNDCRNVRTSVTKEQADSLAKEFDTTILPTESKLFSVAPDRDGSKALNDGTGQKWSGAGDKVVTLVDNIRDDAYYDPNNSQNKPYVAGYFSRSVTDATDRNVMTIDAWDWLHRTGANPPDAPVPGDNCASAPARPRLYEAAFAHEYQHLLESYQDPFEETWLNEGLSDFARTATGYVDGTKQVTDPNFDSHLQCFLGNLRIQTPTNPSPRAGCGPENSLTGWGDQPGGEIFADYGAAYSFLTFLYDHYGSAVISQIHRSTTRGLASVTEALQAVDKKATAQTALHAWAASTALDGPLTRSSDAPAALKSAYTTKSLDTTVNWDSPFAYSNPGVPPNGSDFVRLRDSSGKFLRASDIRNVRFSGQQADGWTVDTNRDVLGDDSDLLFSGPDPFADPQQNLDRSISRQVTVPVATPTLTFDSYIRTPVGWALGVVQVSTDGGKTEVTIPNADTVNASPDVPGDSRLRTVQPGLSASDEGIHQEKYDLSAYAGKSVRLSLRYVSADPNIIGWYVDNIALGGTVIADGSSLDDWTRSSDEAVPAGTGYAVQLVGYSSTTGKVVQLDLPMPTLLTGSLSGAQTRPLAEPTIDTIAAIVTYDDVSEKRTIHPRYTLTVNGVRQPGG